MTQARRGMKLKRTHPRVGRKRKAASPWDRGDLPFRLMFALVALCFLLRVFLSDTERKRVKIGARWSIFWTRISGGDSKINKKKIRQIATSLVECSRRDFLGIVQRAN